MKYTKNNPLRVVTLCSGYDSQCLALNRLREAYPDFDYRLVAWSEWDPESEAPTDRQPAVIAHKALFPDTSGLNLGDMTKIDWKIVPDFDLLFYSTPCFVAGTLVLTESYKWAFLIYCVFLLIVSVAAFMTCLKHMFDND